MRVTSSEGQANADSFSPSVSDDGRYVAFDSNADNLVPGDANDEIDVFVRDRQEGRTWRISMTADGHEAQYGSGFARMSPRGAFVVFHSDSPLLGESEGQSADVYLYELATSEEPPPGASFTVKPQALDFGGRPVGSSTTQTLWLRNQGEAALALASIALRGEDRTQFTLAHRCGTRVAPGASCGIDVTFAPTSPGAKEARVRVETADGTLRLRPLGATATP